MESRSNLRLVFSREEDDDSWKGLLARSITKAVDLPKQLCMDVITVHDVTRRYPMRINPYYLGLIKETNDPLWLQAIPDFKELNDPLGVEDPLNEEEQSPVPNITHRYPDRVLFLVSSQCAMYCRFCTRKRKVGRSLTVTEETIALGIEYIGRHREVRDVLLSGGDPLLLTDKSIERILKALRQIPHVEIIRIGTRVLCTLPQRITIRLVNMLKKYHPLYINTHFNHPIEITPEAAKACGRLADAGIPLGCQTVILRGVNDNASIMKQLMQGLLRIRVRPYYLYQADLTQGTGHFRTPIDKGLEIIEALRGHTSGLCVPTFVVDVPGGGGKTPILPNYLLRKEKDTLLMRNYENNVYSYPFATGEGEIRTANVAAREGNHEDWNYF
ncbi:MAG: KamA family radical SAM protein [Deltaproteobacteria bacterium]|nr:MAG: KamA family radical SAM protein [Deltaproteobacteria bacterium]